MPENADRSVTKASAPLERLSPNFAIVLGERQNYWEKRKGKPSGFPPVPGIESFWTLITVIILSANLRPVKVHALTSAS